jgi:multidrug resistance efflux pump
MPNRVRIAIVVIIVLLALSGAGIWFYASQAAQANGGTLKVSGTVETVNLIAAPEVGGRVLEVLVEKGATVRKGDVLFRLDEALMQAQRKQAVTALQSAQDNLVVAQLGSDIAQAALQVAQANADVAKAGSEAELIPANKALQDLYDNAEVSRANAEQTLSASNQAIRTAQYQLDNFTVPEDQKNMTAIAAVVEMKSRLDKTRIAFEPYKYANEEDQTRKDRKTDMDEAQSSYDSAVRRLNLETAVKLALARQDKAVQDLKALENGPRAEDVAAMKARIAVIQATPKQAEAGVNQARIGVTQAQARLKQAQSAVDQAQAGLDLIDQQVARLTVRAGVDATVLSRLVEPGEVVAASGAVLKLGDMSRLTITVYVPEDRYGQIKLGQAAQVTVDSFAGQSFNAAVSHIADQAEYTPRNVQTADGRRTTVFAIELTIDNADGKLKPGMPADVTFQK